MSLSAIVVIADDRAIGKDNGLLCHLPADLKHSARARKHSGEPTA